MTESQQMTPLAPGQGFGNQLIWAIIILPGIFVFREPIMAFVGIKLPLTAWWVFLALDGLYLGSVFWRMARSEVRLHEKGLAKPPIPVVQHVGAILLLVSLPCFAWMVLGARGSLQVGGAGLVGLVCCWAAYALFFLSIKAEKQSSKD